MNSHIYYPKLVILAKFCLRRLFLAEVINYVLVIFHALRAASYAFFV